MTTKEGNKLDNSHFRNIKFIDDGMGEVRVQVELIKQWIDLGMNEDASDVEKALRMISGE